MAYADFVTALMAFFLVMWLLAISSEAGRDALADYFNELTMQDAIFNGGLPSAFTEGGSQGPSILDGGCFRPKTEGDVIVDVDGQSEAMRAQMMALLETTQSFLENMEEVPEDPPGGPNDYQDTPVEPTSQDQQFTQQLMEEVQGSLGDAAAGQVVVEKIKGGLRIQVMDKDGQPMFRSGGPSLTQQGRNMLSIIAERLTTIPNKVSIEGHTDALPFPGQRMTNWELSTSRASAARVLLSQSGVPDDRITMVAGYASTQPLPQTDPNDPINRHISIMIWDEEPEAGQSLPLTGAETQQPADTSAANGTPTTGAPGASQPTGNGAAGQAVGASGTPSPPPLPRPPALRPPSNNNAVPTAPLTGRELESLLIERTMEQAAQPDLSTVGPQVTPPSFEE